MITAKLNVSWRRGEPIDVLVNPNGPKDIEAMIVDPSRGRPSVRFGLSPDGILWFADAYVACHGDESRGWPIEQPNSPFVWLNKLTSGPSLASGSLVLGDQWKLEGLWTRLPIGVSFDFPLNRRATLHRTFLELFDPWRRALTGTNLDTWTKPATSEKA